MIKLHLFLKKARIRKKWNVYKRLWLISFDLTILFYVLFLFGYIMFAVISGGGLSGFFESISKYQLRTIQLKETSLLITMLPIFYLFRAFNQPGILFSNTEYTVTMLTFSRKQVWQVLALERWLKTILLFSVTGLIYALFSATPLNVVLGYIGILIFMNILMTGLEWRVFQYPFWVKLLLFCLLITVNAVNFFIGSGYFALLFVGLLLVLNVLVYRSLLHHIDWKKVTSAVDFKTWSMPLISYATKTKFKKERAYTIWQRMSFWKQPFEYTKPTVYHRLWQLYFTKNMRYILQIAGTLLLFLAVLGFLKEWLFFLAIVIVIHVLASLSAVLFRDRFETDIVQILPWNLENYKQTFLVWVYPASSIFVVPLLIYLGFHLSIENVVLFIMLGCLFTLLVEDNLKKVMYTLEPKINYRTWTNNIIYICFVLAVVSHFYPILLWAIGACLCFIMIIKKRTPTFVARL